MLKSLVLGFTLFFAGIEVCFSEPIVKPLIQIPIGKCSTDISLFDTLKSNGYDVLLSFLDISRPEVEHILFFSPIDNRFVLGHTVTASTDPNKIIKVCIEYIGDTPIFNGDTFRSLVLTQHIIETEKRLRTKEEEKKKRLENENEMYHGDPNGS